MRNIPILITLALLAASCGDPGGSGGSTPESIAARCKASELADQCPLGSRPVVEASVVERCDGSADVELSDGEGAVTGVCRREGQCLLVCNFTDPCRCGVDRITASDGVVCASCEGAAACGDGVCEGGEDPQSCPIDCAATCEPAVGDEVPEQRCNGDRREVCEANGSWAGLMCREDQVCEPFEGDDRLTFCQTRISPSGGTLPEDGVGTIAAEVTGEPSQIRFATATLAGCSGVTRWQVAADGSMYGLAGSVVRADLEAGRCDVVYDSPLVVEAFAWPWAVGAGLRGQPIAQVETGERRPVDNFITDDYVTVNIPLVDIAADGSEIAAAVEVEGAPMVAYWEPGTGALLRLLRFVDSNLPEASRTVATALRFSPNHKVMAEARGETVLFWNLTQGRHLVLLTLDSPVTATAFHPAGRPLAALVERRQVTLWDIAAREVAWSLPNTGGDLSEAAFSPDGQVLAVSSGRGATTLYAVESGEVLRTFEGAAGPVAFSLDGHTLLIGARVFSDTF